MTSQQLEDLAESMAALERKMQQPERGQTTLETLKCDVERLADAVWQVLDHMRAEGMVP